LLIFREIGIWGNENADTLKGTDGTIYAPGLKKDATLFAYNPDMCRSYDLQFLKYNKVKGVKTLDFHLPGDALIGMAPDKDKHDLVLSFEPVSKIKVNHN